MQWIVYFSPVFRTSPQDGSLPSAQPQTPRKWPGNQSPDNTAAGLCHPVGSLQEPESRIFITSAQYLDSLQSQVSWMRLCHESKTFRIFFRQCPRTQVARWGRQGRPEFILAQHQFLARIYLQGTIRKALNYAKVGCSQSDSWKQHQIWCRGRGTSKLLFSTILVCKQGT